MFVMDLWINIGVYYDEILVFIMGIYFGVYLDAHFVFRGSNI